MEGDWGGDEAQLRDLWPSQPLSPGDLPAVVAAREQGWCLAPEIPMWSFLPAVWPSGNRGWVADRSVRVLRAWCDGAAEAAIPWSAWDHVEHERAVNDILMSAGVSPRPFGRLWLLRPPPGFIDLEAAVDALAAAVDAEGIPPMCCSQVVRWTQATLGAWFTTTG